MVINPLAQARHCAIQVVNPLERDPQLIQPSGPHGAKVALPVGLRRRADPQQEPLARSLGNGHRVIRGVAGSGKTMILAYRAEHLARPFAPPLPPNFKPILVLCFNESLATQLDATFAA